MSFVVAFASAYLVGAMPPRGDFRSPGKLKSRKFGHIFSSAIYFQIKLHVYPCSEEEYVCDFVGALYLEH